MSIPTSIQASPLAWTILPLSSISRLPVTQEQPSEAWQRHCYLPYGQPGQAQNQILQYGQPSTLDEFADLAQVANYVQYR